jgi:hypothetical protein
MKRALYALPAALVACSTATPVPESAPPIFEPPREIVELAIDGARLRYEGCSNGATQGYNGAEIRGADGTRVRLVSEVDGGSKVIVFRPGAERGVVLEGCSRVDMTQSTSRRGGSVRGRASVLCDDKGIHVEGTVLLGSCG